MTLSEVKYEFLRYAKGFCFSTMYSVFCTGMTTIICDEKLNLLHKIGKLHSVYRAVISHDEKMLLLISNANVFHIVNLYDFSVTRHVIRGKYGYNLEGRGCWSFTNDLIYILVYNAKTYTSALRCYSIADNMTYKDLFEDRYLFTSIVPVKELNKYLLIGLDRMKQEQGNPDCYNILWFDGDTLEKYPIQGISDDVISSAEYDVSTNSVIVYGHTKTFRYDVHGKLHNEVAIPKAGMISISFSDVFNNADVPVEVYDRIKALSASFGMEDMSLNDSITKICTSADGENIYVATRLGLFIVKATSHEVIAEKMIDYGVLDIAEISPKLIAASTWSGVRFFKIS